MPGPTAARLILDELRGEVRLTRAELIERTGLSRSSVSGAVGELLSSGLVAEHTVESGTRDRRPGRPVAGLSLTQAAGLVAAVEFGRSHMSVAVADLSLRVLTAHTAALDVAGGKDAALRAAEAQIRSALTKVPEPRAVVAVGMGLPAPILAADESVVSGSILPGWGGSRPAAELRDRLGLPVAIDNDANLGALAEVRLGACRGARDVLYLKVSSGIGAGLILDGRVHRGAHGIAGEIGHIPVGGVVGTGRACRCGGLRCLETLASTTAVLEALQPSFGLLAAARLVALAGTEPIVRRVLTDAGRAIGSVVGDLANTLNPAVIVLGGPLAEAAGPVLAGLRESLDRRAQPAAGDAVRLVPGALGERASVLGALISAADSATAVFDQGGRRAHDGT
ncbi:ROK family transcriptional regulator [Actinomadura xylanilytica]|uniref:ROK family transcriptional regulator n=1 Tax=Actinomadura xylanilytica TaxID=887459 RepID=UPI00255AA451|nr:ROK family transcriptional regulator [Actinomadura xylanilytica]MDL4772989.1 ROK family transcriptional regulator [Actinomadura xylanilytica]